MNPVNWTEAHVTRSKLASSAEVPRPRVVPAWHAGDDLRRASTSPVALDTHLLRPRNRGRRDGWNLPIRPSRRPRSGSSSADSRDGLLGGRRSRCPTDDTAATYSRATGCGLDGVLRTGTERDQGRCDAGIDLVERGPVRGCTR